MLKKDFFLKALRAKAHTRRSWVISLLAVVNEAADTSLQENFPYRIVQTTTGTSFQDPENGMALTPIDDAVIGKPLFSTMDGYDVTPGMFLNAPAEPIRTTIGNILFNEICMVPAFGRKFAFQAGFVDVARIETMIAFMMQDTPQEGDNGELYQEELDSTFTHEGVDYHLNTVLKAIKDLKLQPKPFSVKDLAWVLPHTSIDPERLDKANPNVPVIVAVSAKRDTVVDGGHRLQKAVNEGRSTIMGYAIDDAILEKAQNGRVIFVSEYLKFVDAFSYLTEFNQIITQGLTAKAITKPPGIEKFKKELFEKYAGKLDDPTTIALIESELEKFDAEYLKGDPSQNFLINPKSKKVVRKKLFLMYGAEAGLTGGRTMDLVQPSLAEGWDPSKFPAMNNASRAGSYFRGFETQNGGEEVKWLFRASSNVQVVEGDCGTKLGKAYTVTDENYKKLVGLYVITKEGPQLLQNEEMTKTLIGKKILARSPLYCKLPYTDFCPICMGTRLAANKDAVSMAITAEGSAFMLLSMSAMHGKSLSLAKLDLASVFS